MSHGNPNRQRPKRGRPIDPAKREALESSAIVYQGKPCKRGHSGARYVSTGACVACMAGAYRGHSVSSGADEFAALFEGE
jgi:hypothetical protein